MDSKGRSVGTDRPSPPSPGAPSFAEALARDAGSTPRADEDPGPSEEERSGQVEESVQATIDERAERLAIERTTRHDATEESLEARAREHRAETEPAARDRASAQSEARPRDAETASDAEPTDAEPAGLESDAAAAAIDSAEAAARVATTIAAPAEAASGPAAGTPTTTAPPPAGTTAAAPTAVDPALSALAAQVAQGTAGPETTAGPGRAESGANTTAAPAVGGPSDVRTATMRSVTTVEGRPAPTEADLERADRVLETVRLRLQPGLRQATLQLQPEELGRVLIRIRLEGGTARAVVRAETSEALAILEKHVPELRAMFAAQGFEGLELDLGLASEQRNDGGELAPENWGEPAGEAGTEAPLDSIELARALNEMDGLDLWA